MWRVPSETFRCGICSRVLLGNSKPFLRYETHVLDAETHCASHTYVVVNQQFPKHISWRSPVSRIGILATSNYGILPPCTDNTHAPPRPGATPIQGKQIGGPEIEKHGGYDKACIHCTRAPPPRRSIEETCVLHSQPRFSLDAHQRIPETHTVSLALLPLAGGGFTTVSIYLALTCEPAGPTERRRPRAHTKKDETRGRSACKENKPNVAMGEKTHDVNSARRSCSKHNLKDLKEIPLEINGAKEHLPQKISETSWLCTETTRPE